MQRLLIVSNRLPVSFHKRGEKLFYNISTGGLATGLSSLYKTLDTLWIGWPGYRTTLEKDKKEINDILATKNMHPVFLGKEEIEKYYEGFSNKTIWPLFHYFTEYTEYNKTYWQAYQKVNKQFCNIILKHLRPDDIIWIHDYHLMLLPHMLRQHAPDVSIGFFLHIPFPSFEIFRSLPWRKQLLNGLLGADLVGFHTFDYTRHCMSAVSRLFGHEISLNRIHHNNRITRMDCFPMGIDYKRYAEAPKRPEVKREIKKLSKQLGKEKIILSIDRLDYTKGILQRLEAFHQFLHKNPEYVEKVRLILIAVPSRSKVESYKQLKQQLDEMVGRINGEHGKIGWTPIWYIYKAFSFNRLTALYHISDVALVTPFRDGMNLIAKEFIAVKNRQKGVLVLSEIAGAAVELGEALVINPNNTEEISDAIKQALEMPPEEQVKRNQEMYLKIKHYDIIRWVMDFMDRLLHTKEHQKHLFNNRLSKQDQNQIIQHYYRAQKRLLLIDYDGTLVPFHNIPEKAKPDEEVYELIKALSENPKNEVVIISGRNQKDLQEWFGELNLNIVSEHGAQIKEKNQEWISHISVNQEWIEEILPILKLYVERTPGALVEQKNHSLVWHYRKADIGLGEIRARELAETLTTYTKNSDIQVIEGSKVIEIKNVEINKGRAAQHWLNKKEWDFILGMGDDRTDEDMFYVMPKDSYSIKVGITSSAARFNLTSYLDVRKLLSEFCKEG